MGKAFKDNMISVEVKPAYIGRKRIIDVDIIDTLFARSYLEARKKIPKDVDFIIYASLSYIMIIEGTLELRMYSSTKSYKSSEIGEFFNNLRDLLKYKYLASVYLRTLEMQFHFTIIPKGGCGTVDRDLESVYKKTSVLKIVNDDNNCFWYAMACMMNPDKK